MDQKDGGMDRVVDFGRDRHMRCGNCGHMWTVDLEWVERWNEGNEACGECGTNCEAETSARFICADDDPALVEGTAIELAWYHTSTHSNWPPTIDFARSLSDETRRRMGGDQGVERWAHRQATKALHIGNYESAIHNMLRRISDQGDFGSQFYLHRVHLKPGVVMAPGCIGDPSNWVGDVYLDEIASPEVEAVRYVNFHEDPGGVSVAIRPSAIDSTQCVAIPLPIEEDDAWVLDAVARLSSDPPDRALPTKVGQLRYLLGESPRTRTATAVAGPIVNRLPINLRRQFEAATRWHAESEPKEWARGTAGLAALIESPKMVLAELDAQDTREF